MAPMATTTSSSSRSPSILLLCAICLAHWYWMQSFLLDPLRETAAEMVHLDPIDIIAVSYPLDRLGVFVGSTYVVSFLVFTEWWEPKILLLELLRTMQGTTIFWGIQLLCGAHPVENMMHTLWSSLYITTLACPRATQGGHELWLLPQLVKQTRKINLDAARLHGTLLVAIPFQILHVLDWGAQIQRWPLPVLIGCTYGWIVGTVGGLAFIILTNSGKPLLDNSKSSSSSPAVVKRI